MYKIEITYKTGNSLGSHTETEILEVEFSSLEVAKANLLRIKEHYEMYFSSYRERNKSELLSRYISKDWFVNEPKLWSISKNIMIYEPHKNLHKEDDLVYKPDYYRAEGCINLYLDNGNKMQMSCFWIGYFETLLSIKIVVDEEGCEYDF